MPVVWLASPPKGSSGCSGGTTENRRVVTLTGRGVVRLTPTLSAKKPVLRDREAAPRGGPEAGVGGLVPLDVPLLVAVERAPVVRVDYQPHRPGRVRGGGPHRPHDARGGEGVADRVAGRHVDRVDRARRQGCELRRESRRHRDGLGDGRDGGGVGEEVCDGEGGRAVARVDRCPPPQRHGAARGDVDRHGEGGGGDPRGHDGGGGGGDGGRASQDRGGTALADLEVANAVRLPVDEHRAAGELPLLREAHCLFEDVAAGARPARHQD
mmetsp:Transcript_37776/g.91228  ORF Transcript_37776/g.91228 Transcript_37776/m.91228 type:complete len:268 (-) Transcript_37776:322-1125(-)